MKNMAAMRETRTAFILADIFDSSLSVESSFSGVREFVRAFLTSLMKKMRRPREERRAQPPIMGYRALMVHTDSGERGELKVML